MDISIDEIIETCSLVTNNNLEHLTDFERAIEGSQKFWETYSAIFGSANLSNFSEEIRHSQNSFLEINEQICKNKNYLEKLIEETEKLKTSKNSLLYTVAQNEKRLIKAETKLSHINKKMEGLQGMRDKVQVCKLLTNTTFAYKKGSVQGYIVGSNSQSIHTFQLDTNSDVINHIYNTLQKASLEAEKN